MFTHIILYRQKNNSEGILRIIISTTSQKFLVSLKLTFVKSSFHSYIEGLVKINNSKDISSFYV